MSSSRGREGFAVATALFTLIVIGALAMGTLFAATHEMRAGTDALHQARAIMAAELGVEQAIAGWSREWNGVLARGYGRSWTSSTAEAVQLVLSVTRLADDLFVITSEARAGPSRRQVARTVRLDVRDPPLLAALVATGGFDTTTAWAIDGSDHPPAQWDCPAAGPGLAAVAITDTINALRFGHFDWSALVGVANTSLTVRVTGASPPASGEECDTTLPQNWGEPNRSSGGPCTGYYPVIHAPSDLVIDGGRGQGVLVVEGNLMIQGGFEFTGVVLVRGAVIGGAGGGRITGTMAIAGQGATPSSLEGISIEFSRCAARKALLGIAMPMAVVERSWSEGFVERTRNEE
jgi:hypothetical protein